jgi:hypothetical protein
MALIECPECKKPVSSEARACPDCGYPIAEKAEKAGAQGTSGGALGKGPGELLAEVHPSGWGFFWYWVFFFLIVPPIIAWFKRSATVMRVYPSRISIERGIFSKCYQDYDPRDIRSIDVDQSFFKRMLGIGDLTISTSATVDASEVLRSIPDPRGLRDLILAQRDRK